MLILPSFYQWKLSKTFTHCLLCYSICSCFHTHTHTISFKLFGFEVKWKIIIYLCSILFIAIFFFYYYRLLLYQAHVLRKLTSKLSMFRYMAFNKFYQTFSQENVRDKFSEEFSFYLLQTETTLFRIRIPGYRVIGRRTVFSFRMVYWKQYVI